MIKKIIFVFIILIIIYFLQIKENFSPGADIQLLTSKPYYTFYDYIRRFYQFPYFSYRYPNYRYPNYRYPNYRYPNPTFYEPNFF